MADMLARHGAQSGPLRCRAPRGYGLSTTAWKDGVIVLALVWSLTLNANEQAGLFTAVALGALCLWLWLCRRAERARATSIPGTLYVGGFDARDDLAVWEPDQGAVAHIDILSGEVVEGALSVDVAQLLAARARLTLVEKRGHARGNAATDESTEPRSECPELGSLGQVWLGTLPVSLTQAVWDDSDSETNALHPQCLSAATRSLRWWGVEDLNHDAIRLVGGRGYVSVRELTRRWPAGPPSLFTQLRAALGALPEVPARLVDAMANEPKSLQRRQQVARLVMDYNDLAGRSAMLEAVLMPALSSTRNTSPLVDLGGLIQDWLLGACEDVRERREQLKAALIMIEREVECLRFLNLQVTSDRLLEPVSTSAQSSPRSGCADEG